jgi:pyrroloquinoline quinone biosynthesis protein D
MENPAGGRATDGPAAARTRPTLTAGCRPRLARHARLRHDAVRDRTLLLVPERVLVPDETALEVLGLADGARTIEEIVAALAAKYAAAPELIRGDVLTLLQDLADKGFVVVVSDDAFRVVGAGPDGESAS